MLETLMGIDVDLQRYFHKEFGEIRKSESARDWL